MEEHIKGSRSGSAYGSLPSIVGVGAKLGDAALVAVEIFRTVGAGTGLGFMQVSPTFPGAVAALPGTVPAIAAQTVAAPKKFPLFINFKGYLIAGFDGTGPAFTLTETNLDDSGGVTIANLAAFSANAAAGNFSAFKVLTVDKKYKLTYTPATGGPTTGEGYFFIELCGPGAMRPNIPSTTQTIGGV